MSFLNSCSFLWNVFTTCICIVLIRWYKSQQFEYHKKEVKSTLVWSVETWQFLKKSYLEVCWGKVLYCLPHDVVCDWTWYYCQSYAQNIGVLVSSLLFKCLVSIMLELNCLWIIVATSRMCTHSECMHVVWLRSLSSSRYLHKLSYIDVYNREVLLWLLLWNCNYVFNSRVTKILLSLIAKINYEEWTTCTRVIVW